MADNNNKTLFDKFIESIKNRRWISLILLLGFAIITLGTFTDAVEKLISFAGKYFPLTFQISKDHSPKNQQPESNSFRSVVLVEADYLGRVIIKGGDGITSLTQFCPEEWIDDCPNNIVANRSGNMFELNSKGLAKHQTAFNFMNSKDNWLLLPDDQNIAIGMNVTIRKGSQGSYFIYTGKNLLMTASESHLNEDVGAAITKDDKNKHPLQLYCTCKANQTFCFRTEIDCQAISPNNGCIPKFSSLDAFNVFDKIKWTEYADGWIYEIKCVIDERRKQ